jgi:hypothetical protein
MTIVLDSPIDVAIIRSVEKHNCLLTLKNQAERVQHFARRIADRGDSTKDVVIVLIHVNDPHGGPIANLLMPGKEAMWQEIRDQGQVPFARGLAGREGMQEALELFDAEAAEKLQRMPEDKVAVVVVDHGVAEVFAATEATRIMVVEDPTASKELK